LNSPQTEEARRITRPAYHGVPAKLQHYPSGLTDIGCVRGATWINLFGDNAKIFEKMLPEHHGDRNVARVASTSDQDAPNPAAVMPRIEGMPVSAKIGFEPGAEIHWIGISRDANITQVARGVACGDIHAAAQGNRKMGKIAADANPLAKTIERGAIGASFQIIEAEMAMDEVANGLHLSPSSGNGAEGLPGEVHQLAVDFTVTARQDKR
jgi:hypothetical protein